MKIAFLHHVFQTGSGIEQVITDLSVHLRLMGHDVSLITYEDGRHRLPVDNRITRSILAPVFTRTNSVIRRELDEFDVVVTSLYPMSIVPLWPQKVKPKVVFIDWGIQPYSAYKSIADKLYLWLLNRADRYAVKRSDTVIVANKVTREWVEKRGVTPVHLNLYGINFNRLKPQSCLSLLRDKHRVLQDADGVVMYAGRQSPHKNIDILIEAVALLKQESRNVKLLIVGRESFPEYARRLRMTVRRLGIEDSVIFTGLVSEYDLTRYYSICDIFVNASSWEGYLIPEAYAFRKPIIAYNVSPHDETVQHDVTGILVHNLNPGDFAWSIWHLLSNRDTRLAMGEAGYKWAKKNLDYDKITKRFIRVIEGGSI